jgi:hypothetical protein
MKQPKPRHFRAKVGMRHTVRLRFSIRGNDGERSHALVATMRRRPQKNSVSLEATMPTWKCTRLILRKGGLQRPINPRKLTREQAEDLALQAERAAYARLGMRISAEGF